LPEHERIAAASSRLTQLRDLLVAAETEASDLGRDQAKAEADVEQVRARAARDQERLDRGQVGSPRELESLQHEIGSLAKRQSDLEDVVLEIMERLESVQSRVAELRAETGERTAELATDEASRDEQTSVIDAEVAELGEKRKALAATLPADLLALYERLRAHSGGVGAAAIKQRRCEGCRLELGATDVQRFRNAPEDAVLRCEECGRILVRTPDSGL
jgi:predicted  nucleic acid-binding Zn-ribbon protein